MVFIHFVAYLVEPVAEIFVVVGGDDDGVFWLVVQVLSLWVVNAHT